MPNDDEPLVPDYEALFREGKVFRRDDEAIVVHVTPLGSIDFPSGRPIVFDPFTGSNADDADDAPVIAPGRYRAERSDAAEDRALAVRVIFAERPVARWEFCENLVAIDSATMAVSDVSLATAVDDADEDELSSTFERISPEGGFFRAGAGDALFVPTGADGDYQLVHGFDGDGALVRLVIDLGGLWDHPRVNASVRVADVPREGRILLQELAPYGIAIDVVSRDEQEIVLRVTGSESRPSIELCTPDGARINHSALFREHLGTLTLQAAHVLPPDAILVARVLLPVAPMMADRG